MKRILTLVLTLALALSLAACAKTPAAPETTEPSTEVPTTAAPEVTLTAQEIRNALQEQLGDSYGCSVADDEARTAGYFNLDMSQVESWYAESHAVSSANMDQVVILKVKEGYAQQAAASLQEGFNQKAGYAQMYDMDLYRIAETRLFIDGDYVALLVLGNPGDRDAEPDVQAAFAAREGEKVDAAWASIFGHVPENLITIPEPKENGGGMGGVVPRGDR